MKADCGTKIVKVKEIEFIALLGCVMIYEAWEIDMKRPNDWVTKVVI